jgi:osmotically-inducible protein OsmY
MNNESQLRADVIEELKWEPSVNEAEIGISVKDAVVTISGSDESYAHKFAADREVERVSGVRALAEDLHVKLLSSKERSDTDIAHAALSALDWNIEVPAGITLKVENGWVSLDGSVEWQYQKTAAERAVRNMNGVKGISNRISVKPKRVSTFEVGQKIKDALRRTAEVDASHISVEAADGQVTLKGKVRSWAERSDAERAAWAAPGVTRVDDRIEIGR